MKHILALLLISSASTFSMQPEKKQIPTVRGTISSMPLTTTYLAHRAIFTPLYIMQPQIGLGVLAWDAAKLGTVMVADYYMAHRSPNNSNRNNQ